MIFRTALEAKLWSNVGYRRLALQSKSLSWPIQRALAPHANQRCLKRVVLAHVHYSDFIQELHDLVDGNDSFDEIHVSSSDDRILQLARELGWKAVHVSNRGRNFWGLASLLDSVELEEAEVLHVHSKRSPQYVGSVGEKWRRKLLSTLVASCISGLHVPLIRQSGRKIIGVLDPESTRLSDFSWRTSESHSCLVEQGEKPGFTSEVFFPIGGMFISKLSTLREIFGNLGLHFDSYSEEPIEVDGDIVHAVERAFGYMCGAKNTYFICTQSGGLFSAEKMRLELLLSNSVNQKRHLSFSWLSSLWPSLLYLDKTQLLMARTTTLLSFCFRGWSKRLKGRTNE